MAKVRNWTSEEDHLLEINWGRIDLPGLSSLLNRSELGVTLRAKRIGLGPSKDGPGMLNANQLASSVGVDIHCVTDYWIPKCGLKAERKITKKVMAIYLIDIPEFWNWAEVNQDKFDSRRFAPLTLGPEPEWMELKREVDHQLPMRRLQLWTPEEDEILIQLKQLGKTHIVVGEIMGRSANSIERRVARLREREGSQ